MEATGYNRFDNQSTLFEPIPTLGIFVFIESPRFDYQWTSVHGCPIIKSLASSSVLGDLEKRDAEQWTFLAAPFLVPAKKRRRFQANSTGSVPRHHNVPALMKICFSSDVTSTNFISITPLPEEISSSDDSSSGSEFDSMLAAAPQHVQKVTSWF